MSKTRLQLAERLRTEAGIDGNGFTSTENQTGEYAMIVNWVDDALLRIQSSRAQYRFLRKDFSVTLTAATGLYTPTELSITDFANWINRDVRCRLTALGVSDEQEIFFLPWEQFKRSYLFGSAQEQAGRPVHFSIKPDNSIQFWPIPDVGYTITGEYYRTPYEWPITTDPDDATPPFPDRFHMIVVWAALYFYGANYAESDRYVHGKNEYELMKGELDYDQLPQMGWGAPLA